MVLQAHHLALDRPVAIKLLHPQLLLIDEARERFKREARAAAALSAPGVVLVTDFGVTPAGLCFLVMELLKGCDLFTALQKTGPLLPSQPPTWSRSWRPAPRRT